MMSHGMNLQRLRGELSGSGGGWITRPSRLPPVLAGARVEASPQGRRQGRPQVGPPLLPAVCVLRTLGGDRTRRSAPSRPPRDLGGPGQGTHDLGQSHVQVTARPDIGHETVRSRTAPGATERRSRGDTGRGVPDPPLPGTAHQGCTSDAGGGWALRRARRRRAARRRAAGRPPWPPRRPRGRR